MQTSPEQVRQITESILARPEFHEQPSMPWTGLLEQFFKWLGELAVWSAANPGLASALIFVLTILLLGLLGHIAYTVINEFVSLRRRMTISRMERPIQALDGIAENWSDALQLARSALQTGDVYKAVWITHRILLSALDRLDLVKFARWKTNSDYLAECRAGHPLSGTLAELTNAYERVVYAHDAFDPDEAARLLAQVAEATGGIRQ